MYYYQRDGLTLQINLKSLCNLDCDYCLLPKHVKSQKESDSVIIDNAKILVKKIKEENNIIKAFAVFGAEPFTVGPDIMAGVLNIIAEEFPNVYLKIQTNGTLSNKAYIDKFISQITFDEYRLLIGFSIDGVKDIHNKHRCDSWDVAMKNLMYIKEETGIRTNVICTTNIEHFDGGKYEAELIHFVNFMQDVWDTDVTISYADLTIRGVGETHIGESEFSKKFADFLIDNGFIKNCVKLFKDGYCYRKGNACDKTLVDLNQGKTYQCEKEFNPDKEFILWKDHTIAETMTARAARTANYPIAEECHSCEYEAWCNGGCPLKRDKNGLAKSCYVTKAVLGHIKEHVNEDWAGWLRGEYGGK